MNIPTEITHTVEASTPHNIHQALRTSCPLESIKEKRKTFYLIWKKGKDTVNTLTISGISRNGGVV
ncbi:hypothetical protein FRX31_015484 [Thalictrum thalictroides]|uniref:Uncharacterized protein n=1 Tax=Thalictrum thalictroides TaxID=46969 RepID=A0A7J6WD83_THATH|nr:hypothetical protein FRX31_015484 [Thalictrum thalictroides]